MSPDLRLLLEAIVSNIDEGVTAVEPSGRIVFANERGAQLLGFASAEELTRGDASAVRARFEVVVGEDGQPLPPQARPSVRAFSGEAAPETLLGWRTNEMAELRWCLARAVPLRGPDGQVQVVLNFLKDVTEQRRREAEERFLSTATSVLAESLEVEPTLQKLAQTAVPELADWAIVELVDEPGSMARPRRAALAHVDPQKLEWAREVARRWPTPWDPKATRGVPVVIRTGEPQLIPVLSHEMLKRSAYDPEHLAMLERIGMRSFLCVPLRAPGRGVVGALTLITAEGRRTFEPRDVAFAVDFGRRAGIAVENARLYAALEHANQLKDDFLAMLAHELRNPIAPMVNAIHLMKTQPAALDRAQAIIDRQLNHLTRLVDDLLDVSRISRGMIELKREALDLSTVMRDVVEDQRDAFKARGLTLELESDGPVPLNGDPVRLQQVADNLLGNALKFTPAGGRVRLCVRAKDGRAEVSVTDSGQGLDSESLPRLFQPFAQARKGLDRENGGLGLGLAVVRGIVELHSGTVSAHSKGLGQGTTFTVSLPLPQGAPALQRAAPQPLERTAKQLSVLVIDDNVDLANTMRDLLSFEAKQVEVENSGLTALDAIRRLKPDLVICDLGLPGKDGYTIAAEVRADPSLQSVRLVALSGYGMDSDRQRALAAGFSRHLTKPLPPDQLMGLLDEGA